MAFGLGRLQVLESKLDIYEDLSKEMLDKLERAVTSIQDSNQKVAIILERHESRLDEGERANDAIISLIKRVEKNLDELEKKVESNQQLLWKIVGGTVAITIVLQSLPFFGFRLTPVDRRAKMTGEIHRIA